VGQYGRLS